jgi:hypothetical protein
MEPGSLPFGGLMAGFGRRLSATQHRVAHLALGKGFGV